MTNVKWSAFASGTTISSSDIVVGLQSGVNVQWPMSALATFTNAIGNLPQGTAGYALTGNGASAPSYQGFLQSGTGAVTRTWQAKASETVSVQDFGAVGNGSTNDAAAFQAAHDALPGKGGTIFVPTSPTSATYLINTTVHLTKSVRVIGDSPYSSVIETSGSGQIIFDTSAFHWFENLQFYGSGAAVNTHIPIKALSSSASNAMSGLANCLFNNPSKAYWSEYTSSGIFRDSYINGFKDYGLYLANLTNSDIGDTCISNCTFAGDATGGVALYIPSTSGVYVSNCKFNTTHRHVYANIGANNTGDLLFSNCSFEGHSDNAIAIVGTSGVCTKVAITGCQFSSGDVTHVSVGQGAEDVVITGSIFSSTSAATGVGINVADASQRVTITGNEFSQILTAIVGPASANAGITMSGNRFQADVTNIFSGETVGNLNARAGSMEIDLAIVLANSSAVTYVNAFSFSGSGTADVTIVGIVQGVGNTSYYNKLIVQDTTTANLIAPTTSGSAIDVQQAVSGSKVHVQARRNSGGGGTAITVYCLLKLSGYFTNVVYG